MKEARMVINPLHIFTFIGPFVESITFLTRLEKGKNIVIYYPSLGSLLDCLLSIQRKVWRYFFLPSFLIFVVSYEVFILFHGNLIMLFFTITIHIGYIQ